MSDKLCVELRRVHVRVCGEMQFRRHPASLQRQTVEYNTQVEGLCCQLVLISLIATSKWEYMIAVQG